MSRPQQWNRPKVKCIWKFTLFLWYTFPKSSTGGVWILNGVAQSPTIGGGGALVFQAGYHPRKRTFKTHPKHIFFRGMKIDPKYAFLHAFFLICVSCPFQNLSIWPKHIFFPILHVFAPLNDVRAYIAWSRKTTLITFFFTRMISNFRYKWPPEPAIHTMTEQRCAKLWLARFCYTS